MIRYLKKTLDNTNYQEILSKGLSFMLLRLLGAFIGYSFILYITNTYGSDVYGLVAICFSMFMIISVFGRLGLDTNIVRFFSSEKNDDETMLFFRSIFKSIIVSSLFALLIYYFREQLVLKIYQNPKPKLVLYLPWVLAAIPLWNIAMICASYLRAKKMTRLFAFLENPSRFLFSFIFLIAFFLISDNPKIIVKAHFFGVLITALISVIFVLRKIKKLSFHSTVNSWKFTKQALPMLFSSAMLILLGLVDTQIMGVFESGSDIGIYNVSLKIAALTGLSLQAVNSILAPKIAKSYVENNNEYIEVIKFSTKLIFLMSTCIVTVIFLCRKFLLGLFGEIFIEGETILIIFCVGQIINSLSGSVGVILQMIGKQKVYQNFVLVALVINVVLTFILTPSYGGVGAAVSTVISMAFWNVGSAIYLKQKMNITSYYVPKFKL